jgi:hypothetical protein
VPEYNAKLQKSFGREASVGAAVQPDSCLAEPCADWDGAVPEIEVVIHGHQVSGIVLDGGSGVNIMSEETRRKLGLQITDMATFTVKMADQRRVKPIGLIRDTKISIEGLRYATTFTVLRMEDNESSYPILLGRPWLRMAKVKHNWANDKITLRLGGTKKKVQVAKLHSPLGRTRPMYVEGLNWLEGVDQDEEDEILAANPALVSLFEVEVEKIKEQYETGKKPKVELEEDVDSLLYEEEYLLRQSKQPRRVPEDAVVEVNLGTPEEPQPVKISKLLQGQFRDDLVALLKEYKSVFAWTYKDMPGIDPSFYQH